MNFFNQAIACHQSGRIPDAISLYLRVLPMQRDNDELLFTIGTAYCQIGQLEEGLNYLRKSSRINPKNFHCYGNMGRLLTDLRRFDEAIINYNKAISLNPNFPEALLGRGNALVEIRKYEEALQDYKKVLELVPDFAIAHLNKGKALFELQRFGEALASYGQAIAFAPDLAEAYSNRGNAFKELEQYEQALLDYNNAIQANPNLEGAYSNRGCVLAKLKRYDEALADYDKAIALKPDYAEAYSNRGSVLQELKRYDEALAYYDKAIALKPDIDYLLGAKIHTQMHLCDWEGFDNQLEVLAKKIEKNEKASDPFTMLALVDAPGIHKVASEIYVRDKHPARKETPQFVKSNHDSKIKVGYFSADFHDHATMHLMAELFEKHEEDLFEFVAFSFGPVTNDAWQARAKNAFDKFIDCHAQSDVEIAQLSRNLGIDIAVDLKGFTQGVRAGIFAERAAPIQVNFLGYPGTMGAEYIDYLIADEVLVPKENQSFYTEKVAYLPHCYQPNCRNRDISSKSITRSDYGLPEQGIVFSSFNNNYKIIPQIFSSWMRILEAVNGSILWLLASNPMAERNLRKHAVVNGVDPDRLIFAQRVPIEEHLNRIPLADLMLDTFPCGAHTTCSDALRVGLPVVTMAGKSFASRVAASLLTTINSSELIAESQSSYEDLAINLANNPEKLSEIRARLEKNVESSPLFDPSLFARNLESLYRSMYQRHIDKLRPDLIRVQ